MGSGKAFKNWVIGSVTGAGAEKGGALKGLFEGAARKYEEDPETPDFVSERLKAERCGRQFGRRLKSARREAKD